MNIKNSLTKCGTVLALTLLFGQEGLAPMSVLAEETQGTSESTQQSTEKTETSETIKTETQDEAKVTAGNLALDTPNLLSNQVQNASAYTSDGQQFIFNQNFGNFTRGIGNSDGQLTNTYGAYSASTPYITMTGEYGGVVWCINPDKGFPVNIEYAQQVYSDEGIYNILYYAEANGWNQPNANYVDVFVALNIYLGHSIGGTNMNVPSVVNSPNIAFLLNKAQVKDAPTGNFDIKNKVQTADFSKETKLQFTDWYTPETNGKNVTYQIPTDQLPNEVKVELSDGSKYDAKTGTKTVNADVKFRLIAPANFEGTVKFNVDTNFKKKAALIFKPTAGDIQELVKGGWVADPVRVADVQATFFKRMGQFQFAKQDSVTGKYVAGVTGKLTINGETKEVVTGENGFSPESEEYVDGTEGEITEIKAPAGYVVDTTPVKFVIEAGKVIVVTKQNDIQKAQVTVEKTKEVYNAEESTKQGKPIYETVEAPEIPFTQKSTTDITAPDGKTVIEKAGEYTDTQVTNGEGSTTFKPFYNGVQNEYLLTEDETPKNYRPMEPKKIVIPYGDSSVSVVAHTEKIQNLLKKGKLVFNKKNQIDPSNPLNLAGAKFRLTGRANTNTADVDLVFDTTTEATNMDLKAGSYTVSEIEYPNGFTQPDGQTETREIVIEDQQTTTVDWDNAPIDTPVTPKTTTVTPVSTKTTGTLPHTGEKSNSWVAILGAVTIVSATGAIVFFKKSKKAA